MFKLVKIVQKTKSLEQTRGKIASGVLLQLSFSLEPCNKVIEFVCFVTPCLVAANNIRLVEEANGSKLVLNCFNTFVVKFL